MTTDESNVLPSETGLQRLVDIRSTLPADKQALFDSITGRMTTLANRARIGNATFLAPLMDRDKRELKKLFADAGMSDAVQQSEAVVDIFVSIVEPPKTANAIPHHVPEQAEVPTKNSARR